MKAILILLCMLVLTGAAHAEVTTIGEVKLATIRADGDYAFGVNPVLDSSGDWLAFSGWSENGPNQRSSTGGVGFHTYLSSLGEGSFTLISTTQTGQPLDSASNPSWVKSDGSIVAFTCKTDLIHSQAIDRQTEYETYLWNRDPFKIITPLFLESGYAVSNLWGEGKMDFSERYVYFGSDRKALMSGYDFTWFRTGAFRRDLSTNVIEFLSMNRFGQPMNRVNRFLEVSSDGLYVRWTL